MTTRGLTPLNAEQVAIEELCKDFAVREIRPIAAQMDRDEHDVAWGLWNKASDVGLTSFMLPAEHGGGGLSDMTTSALVHEELCWGSIGLGHLILSNGFFGEGLLALGNSDQQARWLGPLCSNRPPITAVAITEPSAGSDAAAIQTYARRVQGGYRVSGQKTWISNGGISDFILLFATVAPGTRARGITAFILEKSDDGFTAGPPMSKMGQRAQPCAELFLDDVFLPDDRRVGVEGAAFAGLMHAFDRSRLNIAAGSIGLARAAYELALEYAQQRETFGKPLIEHQALAFRLADMATRIDASRLLVQRAAATIDANDPKSTLHSAMAKVTATETAMWCTWAAQQIFGGMGYSREMPLEMWLRDARLDEIGEGSSEIMRHVISKEISRIR